MTRSVATLQYNASTYNKKARLFTFNSKNRQIRMGIKKHSKGENEAWENKLAVIKSKKSRNQTI